MPRRSSIHQEVDIDGDLKKVLDGIDAGDKVEDDVVAEYVNDAAKRLDKIGSNSFSFVTSSIQKVREKRMEMKTKTVSKPRSPKEANLKSPKSLTETKPRSLTESAAFLNVGEIGSKKKISTRNLSLIASVTNQEREDFFDRIRIHSSEIRNSRSKRLSFFTLTELKRLELLNNSQELADTFIIADNSLTKSSNIKNKALKVDNNPYRVMKYSDFQKQISSKSEQEQNMLKSLILKDIIKIPFSLNEVLNAVEKFKSMAKNNKNKYNRSENTQPLMSMSDFQEYFHISDYFCYFLTSICSVGKIQSNSISIHVFMHFMMSMRSISCIEDEDKTCKTLFDLFNNSINHFSTKIKTNDENAKNMDDTSGNNDETEIICQDDFLKLVTCVNEFLQIDINVCVAEEVSTFVRENNLENWKNAIEFNDFLEKKKMLDFQIAGIHIELIRKTMYINQMIWPDPNAYLDVKLMEAILQNKSRELSSSSDKLDEILAWLNVKSSESISYESFTEYFFQNEDLKYFMSKIEQRIKDFFLERESKEEVLISPSLSRLIRRNTSLTRREFSQNDNDHEENATENKNRKKKNEKNRNSISPIRSSVIRRKSSAK